MKKLIISSGKHIRDKNLTRQTVDWLSITNRLKKVTICNEKEQSGYFCGGYFKNNYCSLDNMIKRTLLTIDIDKLYVADINELFFELKMRLNCNFFCHTTWRYSTENEFRCRLICPLQVEVEPSDYPLLAKLFVNRIGLEKVGKIDGCSYSASQAMYLPAKQRSHQPFEYLEQNKGYFLDITQEKIILPTTEIKSLETVVIERPLDITFDDIKNTLDQYDPNDLEYDQWLKVGMGLYHQSQGEGWGYDVWVSWSKKSKKHNECRMPAKWESFKTDRKDRVTFASILFENHQRIKAMGENSENEALWIDIVNRADEIKNLDQYEVYLKSVQERVKDKDAVSTRVFDSIIARLFRGVGRAYGIKKTALRQDLIKVLPVKKESGVPPWLKGWVYLCEPSRFYNIETQQKWKKESFDSAFSRQMECVIEKTVASKMALNYYKIPYVEDLLFMPGAPKKFKHNKKDYINSYDKILLNDLEVVPNHPAIERIQNHLKFLFQRTDEQETVLDFLGYVVQNPGKKVRWALMICGPEGNGKSYLMWVCRTVLGEYALPLDNDALNEKYTDWAEGSILRCVEEVYIQGHNRYEILNKVKDYITDDVVPIRPFGEKRKVIPNMTSYMLCSNYYEALPLDINDRRYCVIACQYKMQSDYVKVLGGEKASEKYFEVLYNDLITYKKEIASFLLNYKITARFSPNRITLHTQAKTNMVNARVNPNEDLMIDAICEHECEIVNNIFIDLTYLVQQCDLNNTKLPKSSALSWTLRRLGYRQIENRRIKVGDRKNHYIWYKDDRIRQLDAIDIVKTYFSK